MQTTISETPASALRCRCGRFTLAQAQFASHRCEFVPQATLDRERILQLHAKGLTVGVIAKRVGRHQSMVRNTLEKHGMAPLIGSSGPQAVG